MDADVMRSRTGNPSCVVRIAYCVSESGVALRFSPQSKTFSGYSTRLKKSKSGGGPRFFVLQGRFWKIFLTGENGRNGRVDGGRKTTIMGACT
jgi:hypothetical protein